MIKLKNKKEIEGVRDSGKILYATFQYLKEYIKPGVSTGDLDRLAEEFILKEGATPAFKNYAGFPASICSARNSNVIHGIPSDREILKTGDILGVDIGVDYRGFISDSANTYAVGEISSVNKKLLEVTQEALKIGIEQCVYGNKISDIGKAISSYVEPLGYGIVHQYCGHGVGFSVHEEPQIFNSWPSYGRDPKIRAGMVLAIEPMINLGVPEVVVLEDGWTVQTVDGQNSAHFEHTVAVFKDRTEVLTSEK